MTDFKKMVQKMLDDNNKAMGKADPKVAALEKRAEAIEKTANALAKTVENLKTTVKAQEFQIKSLMGTVSPQDIEKLNKRIAEQQKLITEQHRQASDMASRGVIDDQKKHMDKLGKNHDLLKATLATVAGRLKDDNAALEKKLAAEAKAQAAEWKKLQDQAEQARKKEADAVARKLAEQEKEAEARRKEAEAMMRKIAEQAQLDARLKSLEALVKVALAK